MSARADVSFMGSVNVHLPMHSELHRERIENGYHSGAADVWYSGSGRRSRDLWVKYKFIALPERASATIDLAGGATPLINPLHQEWVRHRIREGRNVRVIVGCNEGGVIFVNRDWERPITAGDFKELLLTREQIAAWIRDFVQGAR